MKLEEPVTIAAHWQEILQKPALQNMWDDYHALKGEPDLSGESAPDPVESVRRDLSLLFQSASSPTPEDAQRLQFLQEFVKAQVRGVNKSSLSFGSDPEKQNLITHLKKRLAEIENILSPEEIKQLSREARNEQRRNENQSARLDGYRNWLYGTLSEDQRKLIKAIQWQTASGPFQPVKSVVGYADHFAGEHLTSWKSVLATGVTLKIIYDSIVFMTDVTGAHKTDINNDEKAAREFDDNLEQMKNHSSGNDRSFDTDDLFSDDMIPQAELQGNEAIEAQAIADMARCMEKVDADWNTIGLLVDEFFKEDCHSISQGLQDWFSIATATPRTIQAGQKAISERIIKEGTLAETSYNQHHESVSKALDTVAIYDNGFHFILLAIGAAWGAKLVKKHGIKTPQYLMRSLTQQGSLIKKRPITLAGAIGGGMHFVATNSDPVISSSLPLYINPDVAVSVVVGALSGYIAQRLYVRFKQNKKFIFNLYAGTTLSNDGYIPPTSLDQKQPRYFLKAASAYLALSALIITANNTGILNEQSPEIFKLMTDMLMGSAAWVGGVGSWLVFDRLDDSFYHYTFLETGMGVGIAATSAMLCTGWAAYKIPGVSSIATAWKKAVQKTKKSLPALALAAGLTLAPASNTNSKQNRVWMDMSLRQELLVMPSSPIPPGL